MDQPPEQCGADHPRHWKLCRTDGSCPSRGSQAGEGVHDPAADWSRPHQVTTVSTSGSRMRREPARSRRGGLGACSIRSRATGTCLLSPRPGRSAQGRREWLRPHSGIAQVQSRCGRAEPTRGTGCRQSSKGSQLVAYVDDERFRRGSYEFRAHAQDQAGNEASTGKRTDGSAATLRLPARVDTRLMVGLLRSSAATAGASISIAP